MSLGKDDFAQKQCYFAGKNTDNSSNINEEGNFAKSWFKGIMQSRFARVIA